ncbi:glycine receptor subunit alpha-2-like [Convolutriloba macropyga]|uniref:glycine receptor subunit alpha-2-like n=1 Tax=Convolutriloba macropyga TaxID=536237 RepID=UPI003F51E532
MNVLFVLSCFTVILAGFGVIAEIQVLNGNQRFIPPDYGEPIQLLFGLKVDTMRIISEAEGTITFDATERAQWTDKRLADTFGLKPDSGYNTYEFGTQVLGSIWTPTIHYDTLISNEFTPDGGEVKLSIPGNNIEYHRSGTFTFSCQINLKYFPFDEHTCKVRVYVRNLVVDNWGLLGKKKDFFGMKPNQQTADFTFDDFNYTTDYDVSFQGNEYTTTISEHTMQFHLQRKYMGILVTVILPNITLTVLSWVVFWIDPLSLPERISICIALILSQLILVVGEEENFPSTSDFKLMDLYLMVNFFVNSAAMIECLFASFLAKRAEARKSSTVRPDPKNYALVDQSDKSQQHDTTEFYTDPEITTKPASDEAQPEKSDNSTHNLIDLISRVVFPLGFTLWNIGFYFVITKRV